VITKSALGKGINEIEKRIHRTGGDGYPLLLFRLMRLIKITLNNERKKSYFMYDEKVPVVIPIHGITHRSMVVKSNKADVVTIRIS